MRLSRFMLPALLLVPAADAAAALYCVTNEGEFRAAMAAIGNSFDPSSNEIRLTQRNFFTGTVPFTLQPAGPTGDTVISGGWSGPAGAPCTAQTPDARLTVLDAQGTSAVLSIRRSSANGGALPLIRVANLSIRNGSAAAQTAGLSIENSVGRIEVDNIISAGHRAPQAQFAVGVAITLASATSDIRLRNSLVFDSLGNRSGGFAMPSVLFTATSLNAGRNWYASNNTVIAGDPAADALRMQADGSFWVLNNILRGGTSYGGSITGAGGATPPDVSQLFNNFERAPTASGVVITQSVGNGFADPQLDPALLEPRPVSPLVDAGLGDPPGGMSSTDVFGRPRVFGPAIDVGALELQSPPVRPDPVFGSGFEAP